MVPKRVTITWWRTKLELSSLIKSIMAGARASSGSASRLVLKRSVTNPVLTVAPWPPQYSVSGSEAKQCNEYTTFTGLPSSSRTRTLGIVVKYCPTKPTVWFCDSMGRTHHHGSASPLWRAPLPLSLVCSYHNVELWLSDNLNARHSTPSAERHRRRACP